MISCQEAVRRLWEYLEHEVSSHDRSAVDEHLTFCRRCCGELEFANELRRVLGAAATVDVPADVQRRLAAVLDGLVDAGSAVASGPSGPRDGRGPA